MYLFPLVGIIILGVLILSKSIPDMVKGALIPLFLYISYGLSTSIWCGNIVAEKEIKILYALKVMGTRPIVYWLSNLVFNFLIYLVTLIMISIFFTASNLDILHGNNLYNFILLMIFYGIA